MSYCPPYIRPISPGDLVRLKSGGPVMTVSQTFNGVTVECKWFVGSDLRSANFTTGSVVRVSWFRRFFGL